MIKWASRHAVLFLLKDHTCQGKKKNKRVRNQKERELLTTSRALERKVTWLKPIVWHIGRYAATTTLLTGMTFAESNEMYCAHKILQLFLKRCNLRSSVIPAYN